MLFVFSDFDPATDFLTRDPNIRSAAGPVVGVDDEHCMQRSVDRLSSERAATGQAPVHALACMGCPDK